MALQFGATVSKLCYENLSKVKQDTFSKSECLFAVMYKWKKHGQNYTVQHLVFGCFQAFYSVQGKLYILVNWPLKMRLLVVLCKKI